MAYNPQAYRGRTTNPQASRSRPANVNPQASRARAANVNPQASRARAANPYAAREAAMAKTAPRPANQSPAPRRTTPANQSPRPKKATTPTRAQSAVPNPYADVARRIQEAAQRAKAKRPANEPNRTTTPAAHRRPQPAVAGTVQGNVLPKIYRDSRRPNQKAAISKNSQTIGAVTSTGAPNSRTTRASNTAPRTAHQSRMPVPVADVKRAGLDRGTEPARRPSPLPVTLQGRPAIRAQPSRSARPMDAAQVRQARADGDPILARQPATPIRRNTRVVKLRRGSTPAPADPRVSREPRATAPSAPAPPPSTLIWRSAPMPEPAATRQTVAGTQPALQAAANQRETPPGPAAPRTTRTGAAAPVAQPAAEGLPEGLSTSKMGGGRGGIRAQTGPLNNGAPLRQGPANQPGPASWNEQASRSNAPGVRLTINQGGAATPATPANMAPAEDVETSNSALGLIFAVAALLL